MGFTEVIAVLGATISGCFYINLNMDMGWDQVTLQHVAESHYSSVSTLSFGVLRLTIAIFIWMSVYWLYNKGLGFHIIKNRKAVEISLQRSETFTLFTVWSWIMQVSR